MPRVIQKQWQKLSNYAKESVLESVNPMKFFDLNGCHLKSYLLKFFEKDEVWLTIYSIYSYTHSDF